MTGALFLLALLLVQIALGGIVAGLKAGLVYNTWPLIDGAFITLRWRRKPPMERPPLHC